MATTFSTAGVSLQSRKFSRFNKNKNAWFRIDRLAEGVSG